MSYSVRLRRLSTTLLTFGSATPFLSPVHSYEHDDAQPPNLTAILKTWTIEGKLSAANELTVIALWDALKTSVETTASLPDGCELVHTPASGPATVVESITEAGGYDVFRIERLSSPRTDLQWRGEMTFTIVVSGKKRFLTSVTPDGGTAASGGPTGNIAKLSQTEQWSYSPSGLLTKTLAGELEVNSGSAEDAARELGLQLPGSTFGYVTNGPEGIDVEVLDRGDRRARFASIVQEAGSALPPDVGPGLVLSVTERRVEGEVVTVTSLAAEGVGAESWVRSKVPSNAEGSEVTTDAFRRTASGTFTRRAASQREDAQLTRTHRVSTSGGGRPVRFSTRTGNRDPVPHILARQPVEVLEEMTVEVSGALEQSEFKFPKPIDAFGLIEDTGAQQFVGPVRTRVGKDSFGDLWTFSIRRVYRAPSLANAWDAIARAALAGVTEQQGRVTAIDEVQRQAGP